MNKKELVHALALKEGITIKEATNFINAFVKTVSDELASGSDVRLVGFGSFVVKNRAARKGVDPRTKKPIDIPASKVPKFVAGKGLKEAVL